MAVLPVVPAAPTASRARRKVNRTARPPTGSTVPRPIEPALPAAILSVDELPAARSSGHPLRRSAGRYNGSREPPPRPCRARGRVDRLRRSGHAAEGRRPRGRCQHLPQPVYRGQRRRHGGHLSGSCGLRFGHRHLPRRLCVCTALLRADDRRPAELPVRSDRLAVCVARGNMSRRVRSSDVMTSSPLGRAEWERQGSRAR